MGLGHVKGALAPGLDADMTFVDLDASWTLQRSAVVSSAGYSIYEDWNFRGAIMHAMVRGRWVLRDGMPDDQAVGSGRYVRRRLHAS
jgi:dihydropyrimidinase